MTISMDGWAVVNRQERLMLWTVRQHKRDAVDAFLATRIIFPNDWGCWQEEGFRLCRVSVKELEEIEHEKT